MARRMVTVHQVDVFTRNPFRGNPACVVLDADGLPETLLQDIAREMNVSETAYVYAVDADGRVPVRFFTPTREVPVCGHATLAAHWVRRARSADRPGGVVQTTSGGDWPVSWSRRDGASFVVSEQGPVRWGRELDPALRRRLLACLGLGAGDLIDGWPVQTVSTGHPKVMVPVADARTLRRLGPDMDQLVDLSVDTGVDGWFVFATSNVPEDARTEARMFAPTLGIPEDPVNGSGHGPLAAYLGARGAEWSDVVRHGFWSAMGSSMRRDGRVWTRLHAKGGAADVGGFLTPVFRAELTVEVE